MSIFCTCELIVENNTRAGNLPDGRRLVVGSVDVLGEAAKQESERVVKR